MVSYSPNVALFLHRTTHPPFKHRHIQHPGLSLHRPPISRSVLTLPLSRRFNPIIRHLLIRIRARLSLSSFTPPVVPVLFPSPAVMMMMMSVALVVVIVIVNTSSPTTCFPLSVEVTLSTIGIRVGVGRVRGGGFGGGFVDAFGAVVDAAYWWGLAWRKGKRKGRGGNKYLLTSCGSDLHCL